MIIPKRLRPLLLIGIAIFLAYVLLVVVYFWRFRYLQYDDSYITYRYARNLAEGQGLVFNAGERTNSASSFLYTVSLAVLSLIPILSIPSWGIMIGVVSIALTISASLFLAARLRVPAIASLVALVPLLIYPEFAYWSFSGMETALFIAAMSAFLALFLAQSGVGKIPVWTLAVSGSIAVLIRPEAILIIAPALLAEAVLAKRDGSWSRFLYIAGSTIASAAALFTFYWAYYGHISSDALAYKRIYPYYQQTVVQGLEGLTAFALEHVWLFTVSLFGLIVGMALMSRSSERLVRAWSLPGSILIASLLTVIGPRADYSRYYFMLLTAPLVIAATWGFGETLKALRAVSAKGERWRVARSLGLGAVGIWILALAVDMPPRFSGFVTSVTPGLEIQSARIDAGRHLEEQSGPRGTVLSGDLGAIAFYNPSNKYLDQGLVTPSVVDSIEDGGDVVQPIASVRPEFIADTSDGRSPGTVALVLEKPADYYGPKAAAGCPFEELAKVQPIRFFPSGEYGVFVGRLSWVREKCPD